jgi:threonine dehydratase
LSARAVLENVAHRTPTFTSHTLDERLGAQIVFKGEHLQRAGAFKFRGAYHALSRLNPEQRRRGAVAFSSGNHASGIALAGKLLGVPVTVVMPEGTLPLKRAATLGYGAEIVSCKNEEREAVGARLAEERGLAIIPPYDHEAVIAGQGTAALELIEDAGPFDLLITPLGGGGLLAGTCLAAHPDRSSRATEIWGVEPEAGNDGARSLASGKIVVLAHAPDTIADGLRTRFLGERNFPILKEHVAGVATVSDEEIVRALAWLWMRLKLFVEPSAAVGLAALLAGKIGAGGKRTGIILSGGNADPLAVARRIDALPAGSW